MIFTLLSCLNKKNILQNFIAFLTIIFSFFFIFYESIYSFFDFEVYNAYIESGTYNPRFWKEPLSMYVMHAVAELDLGADAYYFLVISFLFLSFWFFLYFCLDRSLLFRSFVFVFIVFNPLTLIFIQTPRSALSFSFFIISFIFFYKSSYVGFGAFIALSVLSHVPTGFLSLFFVLLFYFRPSLKPFLVAVALFLFYLVVSGAIDPVDHYSSYISSEQRRGLGRLFLCLLIFLFCFFSFKGRSNVRHSVFFSMVFSIFAYMITPYAHRIFYFPFFFSVFYYALHVRSRNLKFLAFYIFLPVVSISFYIKYFSLYGY